MWVGAGLNWNDFLPEDQDMNKFVTEQVSRVMGSSYSGVACLKVVSAGHSGGFEAFVVL